MSKLITYLLFGVAKTFKFFRNSYSSDWDADLNYLLDTSELISVQEYTATFKQADGLYHTVWIGQDHRRDWFGYGRHYSVSYDYHGNEKYAHAYCTYVKECDQYRPSLKTMLRLQKIVDSFDKSTYDALKINRKGE